MGPEMIIKRNKNCADVQSKFRSLNSEISDMILLQQLKMKTKTCCYHLKESLADGAGGSDKEH